RSPSRCTPSARVGTWATSPWTSTTSRRSADRHALRDVAEVPEGAAGGPAGAADADRGEVPRAPHARGVGHVRGDRRGRLTGAPSPDRIRGLLLSPEDAAKLDAPGSTDAAVLVPLYLDAGDLYAVFTRRRDDLSRHAGEISFPGGRQDEPDEDLRVTALRESEEEIGLPREDVELIGA